MREMCQGVSEAHVPAAGGVRREVLRASRYHAAMRPSESEAPRPSADRQEPREVQVEPARLRELPALARLQTRAFPPRLAYTLPTLTLLWALPWVRLLVARRARPRTVARRL